MFCIMLRTFSLRLCLSAMFGALLALGVSATATHAQQRGPVFVIDVKGAIGVATQRQLSRALEQARQEQAEALVVRLDTPGGLVSATREIIQEMVAAPVPIIVYVAPSGSRAASAGTFIVYASHVAAMAPGTNLGAATPVTMGGLPGMPGQQKDKEGEKGSKSAAEQKAINDIVAMLRSLAQLRKRNIEFAEKAVREAETMTGEEAAQANVVEILARDMNDLLAQIDGRTVMVGNADRTLATKGAATVTIEPDWRTRLLAAISDPNVAFILLMIGFYGIILEFWNPGALIPGTVGAIAIILALTALSALPVHYGALGLLILGMALMVGEAFTPGVGILGAGGLVAFVVGAIFLFEGTGWDIEVSLSWPVIAGATLSTAIIVFGIVGAAAKAYRQRPVTGAEEMIGSKGEVVEWSDKSGRIHVHGETWSARADRPLQAKEKVRVVGRDGLTLIVESI
jgi:membrane-bound serine protease (ClpP class)